MISQLTGTVSFQEDNFIILDVQSVGYKLYVSSETFQNTLNKTEKLTFWTHLVVRENALDLYGFLEKSEMNFFSLLITISGIGPKTALGILNVASVDTLVSAISSGDTSYLTKVSGIGAKNAQKIILELKNKIGKIENTVPENLQEEMDSIDALQALGYNPREATKALQQVDKEITEVGARIKEAIKFLGK